jgi:hypothetical protein
MNQDRVVDLRVLETDGYGSGYLITDRLVLTAKHVPGEPAPPLPAACKVRPLANWKDERDGELVWTSASLDAALVRLHPDQGFPQFAGMAPAFGVAPPGEVKAYACKAIGFPRAMRIDGYRQEMPVDGAGVLGVRAQVFSITPSQATPTAAVAWRGYSGAAVFNGELLMAIVETVPEDFGGGVVRAIPVAPLLDDPGFLALMAEAGAAVVKRAVRPVDFYQELGRDIRNFYCYVNRGAQVTQIADLLDAERAGLRGRGFVVEGMAEDQPRLFVERMARDPKLARLLGDAAPDQTLTQITWPQVRTIGDAPRAFAQLVESCAEALALPPEAAADAKAFRAAVEAGGQPLGVWWMMDEAAAGPGHAALVDLWLDFCAEVSAGDTPFVWFFCFVPTETAKPASLRSFLGRTPEGPDPRLRDVLGAHYDAGRLVGLQALGPVQPLEDLGPWIDHIGRLRPRLGPEERRDLRRLVEDGLRETVQVKLLPFTRMVDDSLRNAS